MQIGPVQVRTASSSLDSRTKLGTKLGRARAVNTQRSVVRMAAENFILVEEMAAENFMLLGGSVGCLNY